MGVLVPPFLFVTEDALKKSPLVFSSCAGGVFGLVAGALDILKLLGDELQKPDGIDIRL